MYVALRLPLIKRIKGFQKHPCCDCIAFTDRATENNCIVIAESNFKWIDEFQIDVFEPIHRSHKKKLGGRIFIYH